MSKYLSYLKYVLRHKWFVFQECRKLGITWKGIVHDLSKFLPSEFFAYAEYFHGKYPMDEKPPKEQKAFDLAWLYHQKRNKHHWQWWVLKNDGEGTTIIDMPLIYRKEMLADWRGAGRAITGKDNTNIWYKQNKDKMILHNNVRWWIEDQLY